MNHKSKKISEEYGSPSYRLFHQKVGMILAYTGAAKALVADEYIYKMTRIAPSLVTDSVKEAMAELAEKFIKDKSHFGFVEYGHNLTLIQILSAFEVYFKDAITELYISNSTIVPKSAKVSGILLVDILHSENLSEMRSSTIKAYLACQSLKDLTIEFCKTLREKDPDSFLDTDLTMVRRAILIRNLLIHKGGIIDKRFVDEMGSTGLPSLTIENIYRIDSKEFFEYIGIFSKIAIRINSITPSGQANLNIWGAMARRLEELANIGTINTNDSQE